MNKVVVLGGPQVGKKQLLKGIVGQQELRYGNSHHIATEVVFPLATKYYDADLHMWVVKSEYFAEMLQDMTLVEPVMKDVGALILVFDLSDRNSFLQLKRFAAVSASHERPAVCLCVGMKADLATDGDLAQEVLDWCIESSFEYVPASCASAETIEADGDEAGAGRVLEALKANMWPNMVMRTHRRPDIGEGGLLRAHRRQADRDDEEQRVEDLVAPVSRPAPGAAAMGVAELPASAPAPAAAAAAAAAALSQPAKPTEDPRLVMLSALAAAEEDAEDPLDDTEREIRAFDAQLKELLALRDSARTLPMADRRQMAMQVAMRFWREMGGDEDGGDEEFMRIIAEADEDIARMTSQGSGSAHR